MREVRLRALPVSVRGVRRAGHEQTTTVGSSLGAGGRPLNRRGPCAAGRPDAPSAEAGRLRPRSGGHMDGLRALQEAGAMTKQGEGRPEVRWAYEVIV
ncbi:hypothetical protein [Streptomyces sp. AK04-3B]|uniref:hypothetical protein n=1 Tax=Streptomyces sp. AK04-3B TaxID=3028650 RepID=UPI0029A35C10|nr:hypothetical protein [Streptomyces sp. AK04-3B]MDX3802419.1 hypothetical protein [Streptomyces sp. AK04-3B]